MKDNRKLSAVSRVYKYLKIIKMTLTQDILRILF